MPDPVDLAAVRALADAATAGPWEWKSWDDRYESVRNVLVRVGCGTVLDPDGGESRYRAITVGDTDAAFIAAARTVVPALCDEVERLRAALDEAQLRSIEARNPGIDMDEVRRVRARGSADA